MRKSRAKKRKSQPDDSDEEMQDARPTKIPRSSASKKGKEKAKEEEVSMSDAEHAKPPRKKAATSESKSRSIADGKKMEPAFLPETPVNKKKSEKPRKKVDSEDERLEDGKRASTPPVLKVRSNIAHGVY